MRTCAQINYIAYKSDRLNCNVLSICPYTYVYLPADNCADNGCMPIIVPIMGACR